MCQKGFCLPDVFLLLVLGPSPPGDIGTESYSTFDNDRFTICFRFHWSLVPEKDIVHILVISLSVMEKKTPYLPKSKNSTLQIKMIFLKSYLCKSADKLLTECTEDINI